MPPPDRTVIVVPRSHETAAIEIDGLTSKVVETGVVTAYANADPDASSRWLPLPITPRLTTVQQDGTSTSETGSVTFSIEPGVFRLYVSSPTQESLLKYFPTGRLRIVVAPAGTEPAL